MGSYTDFGINCIVYLKYIFENYLSAYFLHSLAALLANLKQTICCLCFHSYFHIYGEIFSSRKAFFEAKPIII